MLWVESELGSGSTFHFTVGFRLPTGAHKKAESTSQLEWEGLPVLAVDDTLTNRRILKEMLANLGMKPALAELRIAAYLSKRSARRSSSKRCGCSFLFAQGAFGAGSRDEAFPERKSS